MKIRRLKTPILSSAVLCGILVLLVVLIPRERERDSVQRPLDESGAVAAKAEAEGNRETSGPKAVASESTGGQNESSAGKDYPGKLSLARSVWKEAHVVGSNDEEDGVYRRTSFYRAEGLPYENVRFDEVFTANPDEDPNAELIHQEAYVADHFLVRLRDEQAHLIDALLARFDGLSIREELSTGKHVLLEFPLENFEVDLFRNWTDRLASHGLVAEKDRLAFTALVPQDPDYDSQWALENTGQEGGTVDADIDAEQAWDIETGSEDVIVAVLDTGIDLNHPDLISNIWRSGSGASERQGFDSTTGSFLPEDTDGHGTHVSGTIGARSNNGRNIAGVNWNVRIMAVKVFREVVDPETEEAESVGLVSDIVEGIDFAVANGATIMNMSLGLLGVGQNDEDDSLYVAIRDARDTGARGVLAVAAAGNDGTDMDATETLFYPAAYELENIVSIGASDRDDQLASFSNRGETHVDLAAPGEDILSTMNGGGTETLSGTSMAAPHVAGVAALLQAADETLGYEALKTILMQSVDKVDGVKDLVMSDGRLNAYNALLSLGEAAVRVSGIDLNPDGNGDEFWTEMEPLTVDVGLQNFGGATATDVSMTIEIVDGDASITSAATVDLSDDIVSDGEVFIADAFEITAGDLDQFSFSEQVEVKVTVGYDGGSQHDFALIKYFQPANVSGFVLDGSDDSPIEDATVTILADTEVGDIIEMELTTGPDGSYDASLFTGLVTVQASAEGYVDSLRRTLDLNPVEPNQNLDIVLGIGDFEVSPDPVEVTVPPGATRKLGLVIDNLSTFEDPLPYFAEVSEDLQFFGENELVGLVGLGTNVPDLVRINRFSITPNTVERLSLPSGHFSVDLTAHESSIWILCLTADGGYALNEYNAQTLNFIRTVDLYLGLRPAIGGGFEPNPGVSVETVFVVPIPDADAPGGHRKELAVITHDTDEEFRVNVYRVDPESPDAATREVKISDLGINSISWFNDPSRRSGAFGGDRDSFFYGRGTRLYEYEVSGPMGGTSRLKETSIFQFDNDFFFFLDDFDFNYGDVKALAYYGVNKSLYILLNSTSRNLIQVDWDSDTLIEVYDAPADIDRITASPGSTELDWLRMDFNNGSIEHEDKFEFPITLDTSGLSSGSVRNAFLRMTSPNSATEEIVSVQLTVGNLGFNPAFVSWYQEKFAADPTSVDTDSDGGGNEDALEYVTGSDPTNPLDDKPVPSVIFDPESGSQDIYLKFRQRNDLEDGVVTVQGRGSMQDPWEDLVEGVDYEVIFDEPVSPTVNELTISTAYDGTGFFRLLITL